jgi:hypothetical protein
MTGRRNSGMRFGAHPVNSQKPHPSLAVRAELIGSSTAIAFGIVGHGNAPVLDLCRKLVEAGFDPDLPLTAFRGATLCLRIRSIGEAAGLEINGHGSGFKRRGSGGIAPPVRQNGRGDV